MSTRLTRQGLLVSLLGMALWMSPARGSAGTSALSFCNTPICVTGATCDEESIDIVCNGFCPAWTVGICWNEPGREPCDGDEIKFVCYDEPM
jgi:hypothetical protein